MRKEESPGTPVSPNLLAQMGYETRDVILRPLVVALGGLLALIVATLIFMFFLYQFFIPDWAKVGKPGLPSTARRLPPNPQLQADPKRDMVIFREAEDAVHTGTVADTTGAKPTMKIEDAIETMATQTGIAGVTGTEVRQRGTSGPGQRTADKTPEAPSAPGGHGGSPESGTSDGGHSGATGGH
jgi:hypothetical protein